MQRKADFAVLRVRDNGVGIAPDLLPNIFDLFTQANRTLDRAQGGLGIGLTLVKKIVELHRGMVEAKSTGIGQGSEFVVRLPTLVSQPLQKSKPFRIAEPFTQTSRVLVVDDNVDAADTIVLLLRQFGYDVQAAYSGEAALSAVNEFQPNIVILDIGLPEMDGYEIARRLRHLPQLADVWLIAMTGYGTDTDQQRSKEAGFDHHLVKPVDPQKLEELLADLSQHPPSAK